MTTIIDLIKQRRSVRTFNGAPVEADKLNQIKELMTGLEDPYFRFGILDLEDVNGNQYGAYGVIKGTGTYIVGAIKKEVVDQTDVAMAFGYGFEEVVLKLTDLGLGSCWIAGTFKPEDFRSASGLTEAYQIVMICPIGYEHDKRLLERAMRFYTKADQRQPISDLVFDNQLGQTLTKEVDAPYMEALEMVRLAPSAKNLQPWRMVVGKDKVDFYIPKDKEGYLMNGFNVTYNDMGIAKYHFEKTLGVYGIIGEWFTAEVEAGPAYTYVTSWREKGQA